MTASDGAPGSSRRFREWQLILPLALFFTVFVLAPLCLLAAVSGYRDSEFTAMGLTQYVKFLGDAYNLGVLARTLQLALYTTILTAVIGYPLAYLYVLATGGVQRILLLVIVLPLLTSAVVRTFAWVVILGREGIINNLLLALHAVDGPMTLLYTPFAVAVASAQIELPLMVLPIITALMNIDPNIRQASEVLGAGKWCTFFAVTLPLSTPGLFAGCLLVFAATASAFVTQTLVGGGRLMFMPLYIYQQSIQMNNYPFAAATAVILLVTVLSIVTAFNLLGRRSRASIHG